MPLRNGRCSRWESLFLFLMNGSPGPAGSGQTPLRHPSPPLFMLTSVDVLVTAPRTASPLPTPLTISWAWTPAVTPGHIPAHLGLCAHCLCPGQSAGSTRSNHITLSACSGTAMNAEASAWHPGLPEAPPPHVHFRCPSTPAHLTHKHVAHPLTTANTPCS